MNSPSAIPSKIGFYLLLLFSFSVSVFPTIAFILAAAATFVWLVQYIIFKETDLLSSRLFYPIAGLTMISAIVLALSKIYGYENQTVCAGFFSFFYFVVHSFIPSQEKRKMVIWTFLSGVILSLGISILSAIDITGYPDFATLTFPPQLPVLILMVFCLALAYFAESVVVREKIFFALIFLPIGIGALTFNIVIALVLFVAFVIVGIFKDRSVLILVAIVILVTYSGFLGLNDRFEAALKTGELGEIVKAPITAIRHNPDQIKKAGFYGLHDGDGNENMPKTQEGPFFLRLIRQSGPPSFLFFIWALYELMRRDITKIRKLNLREERAYHLASFLAILVVLAVNMFQSSLSCSPAILGLWMFMGMAEV